MMRLMLGVAMLVGAAASTGRRLGFKPLDGEEGMRASGSTYWNSVHYEHMPGRRLRLQYEAELAENISVINLDNELDVLGIRCSFSSDSLALSMDTSDGTEAFASRLATDLSAFDKLVLTGRRDWGCVNHTTGEATVIVQQIMSIKRVSKKSKQIELNAFPIAYTSVFKHLRLSMFKDLAPAKIPKEAQPTEPAAPASTKLEEGSPAPDWGVEEDMESSRALLSSRDELDDEGSGAEERRLSSRRRRRSEKKRGKKAHHLVKDLKKAVHEVKEAVKTVVEVVKVVKNLVEGHIDVNKPVQGPHVAWNCDYDVDSESCTATEPSINLTADGFITCKDCYYYFGLGLSLELDIQDYHMSVWQMAATGTALANLGIEVGAGGEVEWNKTVATIELVHTDVQLGPVPLLIKGTVPITIGSSLTLDTSPYDGGLLVQASAQGHMEQGYKWTPSDDVQRINTHSMTKSGPTVTVPTGVSVMVSAWIQPQINVILENFGGPVLGGRVTLTGTVSVGSESGCQDGHVQFESSLDIGIGISAVVDIELWKKSFYQHQFPPLISQSFSIPLFSGCASFGRRLEAEGRQLAAPVLQESSLPGGVQPITAGTSFVAELKPKDIATCANYPGKIVLRCVIIDDDFDPKTIVGDKLSFSESELSFGCTQTRLWNVTLTSPNLTDTRAHPSEVSHLTYILQDGVFKPEVSMSSCAADESDPDDPCYIAHHDESESLPMQMGELEFTAALRNDILMITDIIGHSECYELPVCLARHGSTTTTCTDDSQTRPPATVDAGQQLAVHTSVVFFSVLVLSFQALA